MVYCYLNLVVRIIPLKNIPSVYERVFSFVREFGALRLGLQDVGHAVVAARRGELRLRTFSV